MVSLWKNRILDSLSFLRLKPFDTATPEGRDAERKRRVALTASSSAIAQAIRMLVSLASISLLIGYLGNERYGMWLTISSIIAVVRFTDLGIGNGLLNAISEADGKSDKKMALRAVSSALTMLSLIALALGALFVIAYRFVPWERVFNVSAPLAVEEAGPAIAVFAGIFLINMPLAISHRTQMGYQEGYWNDLWLIVGSLIGIIGIFIAIQFDVGTPGLILIFVGAPAAATLCNGLVLFGIRRPWLRPRISLVSKEAIRKLAKVGVQFFALQVTMALAYTADRIVIAQIMGAESVPQYAVPQRMFGLVTMVIGFILVPLWPAYGEAFFRGDIPWIRRNLVRSILMVLLLTVPGSILLILLGRSLIELLVGDAVQPTSILLLGFGVWTIISSIGNAFAMALNGMGILGLQIILAVIMALSNLALSIILTARIGAAGPVWGSVITYSIIILVPTTAYLFLFKLKDLEEGSASETI